MPANWAAFAQIFLRHPSTRRRHVDQGDWRLPRPPSFRINRDLCESQFANAASSSRSLSGGIAMNLASAIDQYIHARRAASGRYKSPVGTLYALSRHCEGRARQHRGIFCQARGQEFQRHLAAQAEVFRLVDDSHAATTKGSADLRPIHLFERGSPSASRYGPRMPIPSVMRNSRSNPANNIAFVVRHGNANWGSTASSRFRCCLGR